MSQCPCVNQMVMVSKLLISMSHGPKGSTNSKPALQGTETKSFFFFSGVFFFPHWLQWDLVQAQ